MTTTKPAGHEDVPELAQVLAEMGVIVSDPMWAEHVELNKTTLRRWISALRLVVRTDRSRRAKAPAGDVAEYLILIENEARKIRSGPYRESVEQIEYCVEQLRAALAKAPAVATELTDGDLAEDERWNAGVDYAITQLCTMLGVDPKTISWDAATETLDGDVASVLGNALRARYGDEWGSSVDLVPAPPAEAKPVAWSVKPLEWRKLSDAKTADTYGCRSIAGFSFGQYFVNSSAYGSRWNFSRLGYAEIEAASEEDAKAAAQADYERRTNSALIVHPDPRAKAAEAVPEGMVLVPREPTLSMVVEGNNENRSEDGSFGDTARRVWAAMLLAAAPQPLSTGEVK